MPVTVRTAAVPAAPTLRSISMAEEGCVLSLGNCSIGASELRTLSRKPLLLTACSREILLLQ